MGWDFGFRNPAVVAAQDDPMTGQIRVLWSQQGERILLDDFAKKIVSIRNRKWPGAEFLDYCDPHGRNRDDRGNKTSIDILKDNGVHPRFKDTAVTYGINIMAELLTRFAPKTKQPSLIVDGSNAQLVADAFHIGYVQDPRYDEEQKPDMLVPFKDGFYDHAMDALRYILVHLRGDARQRKGLRKPKRQWKPFANADGAYDNQIIQGESSTSKRSAWYGFGRDGRGSSF